MRLTHLADYAVVMMTAAARRPAGARLSATELVGRDRRAAADRAEADGPARRGRPAVQRRAARAAASRWRGRPTEISLADIVEAVEGPIAMTICSERGPSRLRARRPLPGQAAHGRRRQCGARRARARSLSASHREAGAD